MEPVFQFIGTFKTSQSPTLAKPDIPGFVEEAEKGLLRRGVPAGRGASIKSWNVEENGITFEIESDRYLRPHEAFLRLRKPLAAMLGKKYRIGIRGIEVKSYKITLPTEKDLKSKKIPFVERIEHRGGGLELTLKVGESELERRIPDRIITLVEEKLQEYGGKAEHWSLLWESEKKPHRFKKDPTPVLEELGWIKRGSSRGQWIYGPQITHLFRSFEKIVLEEIIEPLGYREMIFPKLVTWDVWKRSGHARGIYPEIYYVCPPRTRDPSFWEEIVDYYRVTLEVPVEKIKEKLAPPIGGMCYAQCPPFWQYLQGETLPDSEMPLLVFDRSGTSHRYESGGLHGMERVDEFHRIELVWLGTPDQVLRHSQELQERYRHIFNEILDLEWRMAWVTPWFMAQEGLTGLADRKEIGTIDFEARLPYREGEWLEFQNLSVNGDKYPRGFNVKIQSGKELWSGCSGIGLERWASAFLAQKGPDPAGWPEGFREKVGELPRGIKFL